MADKVKMNQFTPLLEKKYVCQGLKLLKLGCELKLISDILIMILGMNGLKTAIPGLRQYSCCHYSFLNY